MPVWRRLIIIPTLVAARPRLILTLDLLKFPTIKGAPRSPKGVATQALIIWGSAPSPPKGASTLRNPNASRFAPELILTIKYMLIEHEFHLGFS